MMKPLILLCILCGLTLTAQAQTQTPPESNSATASLHYTPGKTSLEESLAYWQSQAAKITARGYLALGSGSGLDNVSKAYDKNVELIDVTDIDFEGMKTARFLFYKGVLLGVQVRLKTLFKEKKALELNLSQEELDALEKNLINKYGKPSSSQRSLTANGKKPDMLSWNLKENRLSFSSNPLSASLVLTNPALEKEVEKNRKEVCKEFNTKEKTICW